MNLPSEWAAHLAHYGLMFGQSWFICFSAVLSIFIARKIAIFAAVRWLLVAMIINTALKIYFAVPLMPHLGAGYAFPSGHMHAAAAFYLAEALNTSSATKTTRYVMAVILAILAPLGFGLVHAKFHSVFDVIGALGCAGTEVLTGAYLKRRHGALAEFLYQHGLVLLALSYLILKQAVAPHVYAATLGLIVLPPLCCALKKRFTVVPPPASQARASRG